MQREVVGKMGRRACQGGSPWGTHRRLRSSVMSLPLQGAGAKPEICKTAPLKLGPPLPTVPEPRDLCPALPALHLHEDPGPGGLPLQAGERGRGPHHSSAPPPLSPSPRPCSEKDITVASGPSTRPFCAVPSRSRHLAAPPDPQSCPWYLGPHCPGPPALSQPLPN